MQKREHMVGGAVRSGLLDGALRPRIVGLAESLAGPSWFALMIESGRARIGDDETELTGPLLTWQPWNREARARFAAGATGSYVVLGSTALANAVGYMAEARELREVADRVVTVPLSNQRETFEVLRFAFAGLNRELGSNGPAARAVVEAYLRVILVEVYRAGQSQIAGRELSSPSHRAFARFGELVEAHFRDRWSVIDYAAALGMSRDRLGDICMRVRGLHPKELVDRRISVEARLQLENSSNSIQQISELLGFASASQFSRFFKRTFGVSPGHYRQEYVSGIRNRASERAQPYQWP